MTALGFGAPLNPPRAPGLTALANIAVTSPMAKYYCKHCKQTLKRDSNKAWIKSYCGRTGKNTHMIKVEKKKKKE